MCPSHIDGLSLLSLSPFLALSEINETYPRVRIKQSKEMLSELWTAHTSTTSQSGSDRSESSGCHPVLRSRVLSRGRWHVVCAPRGRAGRTAGLQPWPQRHARPSCAFGCEAPRRLAPGGQPLPHSWRPPEAAPRAVCVCVRGGAGRPPGCPRCSEKAIPGE